MIYKDKEILIFDTAEQIIDYSVKTWIEISETAIREKGGFTVALSGGRTPVSLYQTLAEKSMLPWDKTHIFIVDERFVPFEHEDSNYRMIYNTLLKHIKIPSKNIHPVITEDNSPALSAEKYEKDIISFFKISNNELPRFDLILLGLGDDGHTASLFPGTPALKEKAHLSAAVKLPDKSKKDRITLTFPVINNANNIIFTATGDKKANIIRKIIDEDSSLPASMVRPEKGKLIFLLDEGAGSLVP
jgi:6-phosphogluconolactonase